MHAAQLKPNASHSMKVIATDPTGACTQECNRVPRFELERT
jgi:hypothetical protein